MRNAGRWRDLGDDRAAHGGGDLAGWSERYPDVKVTRLVTGRSATDALVGASPHAGLIVVGAHAGGLPHDPVTRRCWPPRPARSPW